MHSVSRASQRGNVLFLILIAVALFAALSYAVTSSNRSGSGDTSGEKAKLSQAVLDSYMAAINVGTMRLNFRGCGIIDYTPPAGWGSETHNCHLFHPDGGQVIYQDLGLNECDLTGKTLLDLSIGEGCGNTIYAGSYNGYRLYTTPSSFSPMVWQQTPYVTTNTTSTDGLANTNTIISLVSGSSAASACRALGEKWFLPTAEELVYLYNNRNVGSLSGTFTEPSFWTSKSYSNTAAAHAWINHQYNFNNNVNKAATSNVRCMRRD